MKNVIVYVAVSLCLFAGKAFAQQTFESKAKAIADKIAQITTEEKAALKAEVESVNRELEAGNISVEKADERKLQFAEMRAANIERRTAAAQEELKKLVQDKVDGKIQSNDSVKRYSVVLNERGLRFKDRVKDTVRGESRTTSQFVFAFGLNHYLTDGAMAHSDYRVWGSHFYEWGITMNSRLARNSNLLHAKYGLSLQYNNVRPTDNRVFEENGDQTDLVTSARHLGDSRFRNVNLVVPVYLEFDFSGNHNDGERRYFRTQQGFRLGLGGFVGANVKSKQIIEFEDDQNNDVTQKTKGDFNVNTFVYGVGAYIGYRDVSLYAKYDLQPVFEDNAVDQNNISFGIRFDLN